MMTYHAHNIAYNPHIIVRGAHIIDWDTRIIVKYARTFKDNSPIIVKCAHTFERNVRTLSRNMRALKGKPLNTALKTRLFETNSLTTTANPFICG